MSFRQMRPLALQFGSPQNASLSRKPDKRDPRTREIDVLSCSEPVRMLAVEGFEQKVVRFTTDIPYLTNWGKPLLLGPGSILVAHTKDEFVVKKDLETAVGLYVELVKSLLKQDRQDEQDN